MSAAASGRERVLIGLAGQPNVGKTTVFNLLTGLEQHVGNWAGKTVERAEGTVRHEGVEATLGGPAGHLQPHCQFSRGACRARFPDLREARRGDGDRRRLGARAQPLSACRAARARARHADRARTQHDRRRRLAGHRHRPRGVRGGARPAGGAARGATRARRCGARRHRAASGGRSVRVHAGASGDRRAAPRGARRGACAARGPRARPIPRTGWR